MSLGSTMAQDFSPFEAALEKLKKKERTPWGKLQGLSHRWLGYLETAPLLQAYRAFFKGFRAAPKLRPDPAIDLDSLFLLSLILHLLAFLLLAQITFRSGPSKRSAPILVRILEAEGAPAEERTKKEIPRVAKPKAAPSRATEPRPAAPTPLPSPKALAELTKERTLAVAPQPEEALVQLPTRQAGAGEATLATKIDPVPSSLGVGSAERESREGREAASALLSAGFGACLDVIKRRVESFWKYPERVGGEHRVDVVFALDQGGGLARAEVLDSTDSRLNSSALQAMQHAAPFPCRSEILRRLGGQPLRMRFKIDFGVKLTR